MPGKKYGDKIKGYVINFNPANLLVGLRADHGGEAEGRRRRQPRPRLGRAARRRSPMSARSSRRRRRPRPTSRTSRSGSRPIGARAPATTRRTGYPIGITIPKEGTIGLANCAGVPVGATNKKLAFEFLNFRLDRDVQRDFHLGYFSQPGTARHHRLARRTSPTTQIVTEEQMDAHRLPRQRGDRAPSAASGRCSGRRSWAPEQRWPSAIACAAVLGWRPCCWSPCRRSSCWSFFVVPTMFLLSAELSAIRRHDPDGEADARQFPDRC